MNRIIIDSDAGVDDAHAILLAFGHQDTMIEAITSVSGNVDVEKTTANVLKVLDVVGANVPVFRGCDRPLVRQPHHAAYVHGEDGLGDCGIPASNKTPQEKHAVQALIDFGNQHTGQLSLVAIGPLTNIAAALILDPSLPSKYKNLTIMGGAVSGRGNTNINAEFNMYFDPEAAAIVFQRWPMTRLLDWEATLAAGITEQELESLLHVDTKKGAFFRKTNQNSLKFIKKMLKVDMMFAPDGLAMASALDPQIVKRSENLYMTVSLDQTITRGQTIVDWFDRSGKEPNVEIIMDVDQTRFISMLLDGLR